MKSLVKGFSAARAEDVARALTQERRVISDLSLAHTEDTRLILTDHEGGGGAGCDGLVLSNPWTIEETDEEPYAV